MFPDASGIYVLTSPSGKRYVGKSVNLRKRLRYYEQKYARVKQQRALWKALCKYPWDQWTVEYELMPVDALDDAEIATIAHYNTCHGPGYNLTEGGEGASGRITTPETRSKLSAALKGNTNCKGNTPSTETRAKIAAAMRGNAHAKGTRHSIESREKMSAALQGKKKSAEHRAKMSAAHKGKPCSAATRAKISAKLKGRKPSDKMTSAESIAKREATKKRNRMLRDLLMMV